MAYTNEQLDEIFDAMLDTYPGFSPVEIAAAKVLHRHREARSLPVYQCLQIAREMLAAADLESMTPYFEQEAPKDDTGIAPGSPTDFVLF